MSSWKRNPSRAIKFKTTASGIGSFELHILEYAFLVNILKKYHHWFALFLYLLLSTCVWPWLRGAAQPGGLSVSALQNEVGQHLASLGSQGKGATGDLYLPCSGLAALQHICHGAGWLGRAR